MGWHFSASSGTVGFSAGNATATVTIDPTADTTVEPDETVILTLTSGLGYNVGSPNSVTGTISNDDTVALPGLSIDDVSVTERNSAKTNARFTVSLAAPSNVAVMVNFATADGTATAGSDYNSTNGTLTIPAGTVTGTVTVQVIGDTIFEGDETFFVNLSDATNAAIVDRQGVGTILNDDSTPALSIGDKSLKEGDAGITAFNFTVKLSTPSSVDVMVNFATADDTATAGSNYISTSGTLTIPAGSSTATITVSVNGDTTFESRETFFVNLSDPVNATIAGGQGVGTIRNDDNRH